MAPKKKRSKVKPSLPKPDEDFRFGKTPFYISLNSDFNGTFLWCVESEYGMMPSWFERRSNLEFVKLGRATSLAKAQTQSLRAAGILFLRYKKAVQKVMERHLKEVARDWEEIAREKIL